MKIPDLSIIEKTLNNEATSEESCEVVRWFKTPEGQAWLAERIDQDEKTIHMGEEEAWIDHPIPTPVKYQNIMPQHRRQKIRKIPVFVGKYQPVSRWSPFVYNGKSGSLFNGFYFCNIGYEPASVISGRKKISLYSSDPSGIFRKNIVCAILCLVSFRRLTLFLVHVFDPGFPGSVPGV